MLPSQYVRNLPEVGSPILRQADELAGMYAKRAELLAEAERYMACIMQREAKLATAINKQWTEKEIAAAEAQAMRGAK